MPNGKHHDAHAQSTHWVIVLPVGLVPSTSALELLPLERLYPMLMMMFGAGGGDV